MLLSAKPELSWTRAFLQGAIAGAIVFYGLYIPLFLIARASGHWLAEATLFALAIPGVAVDEIVTDYFMALYGVIRAPYPFFIDLITLYVIPSVPFVFMGVAYGGSRKSLWLLPLGIILTLVLLVFYLYWTFIGLIAVSG